MTDVKAAVAHSLTITVPGILAVFSIDGGRAVLDVGRFGPGRLLRWHHW